MLPAKSGMRLPLPVQRQLPSLKLKRPSLCRHAPMQRGEWVAWEWSNADPSYPCRSILERACLPQSVSCWAPRKISTACIYASLP